MPKFQKANIIDIPAQILKAYSDGAKRELAERSLNSKDYVGFKHILDNSDQLYSALDDAIDRLDVEAVKIVVARAKAIDQAWYKDGSYIQEHTIKNIFDQNIEHVLFDIKDKESKKTEILKILLDSKLKDNITVQELQKLADRVSKQEFEDFVKLKELDLGLDKFKNLELSLYKLEGLEPVLSLKGESIVDLLLSRTFSDKLSLENLKEIYSKLYNLDPIAKEMLYFTAALISQGNSIKIMFGEDTSSYYSPGQNIIKIDNNFINGEIFNTESVVIHEIGHFIYDQIFQNKMLPFDFKPIFEYIKLIAEPYMNDIYMDSTPKYKIHSENKYNEVKEILSPILKYEEVARAPVDKAADLLLVDKAEYSKYLFTNEYTEYFKDNSYIDLFYLNAAAGFKTDKNLEKEIPDHVFNNILQIYLAEQNTCKANPYSLNVSREEIIKWAAEEFLPKLVSELNLSDTQVHFLDRIADYINRGEHLLEDYHSCNSFSGNEKYFELIVRAMEFKAAGLEPELTDSFKGLEQFHIQTISPAICTAIIASEVASMPFDLSMAGTQYECLSLSE